MNSVSLGLTIREMFNHYHKKTLPSKLIRELILVLENQTLQELQSKNSDKRQVSITFESKSSYLAQFRVR